MKINKLTILTLALISSSAYAVDYSNIVPGPQSQALYYRVGGGDIVPTAPSLSAGTSVGINGLGALGYSCGQFNPASSITNALNGLQDTAMNMFNNVVNSATGAIMEMPAYLISKANPALYQNMQNGFFSGQFDITTGLKSCQQMATDIDAGRNPYKGMTDLATSTKWKALQYKSKPNMQLTQMTYGDAASSDVTTASREVAEDNGKSGVPWTHGTNMGGTTYAGGANQPPIEMIHDIVLAGVAAMLSNTSYYSSDTPIPSTDGMSAYFKTPGEAAKWAVNVLGDKTVYTDPAMVSKATPGKGLLPLVQKQYDDIYNNLVSLVSGSMPINVNNLKKVSTDRLMISEDIIKQLQNDPAMERTIETSALAQGVAALKVINQAQEMIMILQAARHVPAIATNGTAQETIDECINTLQQQIQMIVNNQETSKKMLTSTIDAMGNSKASYLDSGNRVISDNSRNQLISDGAIKRDE